MSLFYDSHFTAACDMELHTDSTLIGFGGIFQNQWFCSKWPAELPTIKEGDLSMAFCELYPIVAAALIWGKYWTSKRILFLSDNIATTIIVQGGRSKSIPIMKLMRTLTWTAAVYNFHSVHVTYPENLIRQLTVCHGLCSRSSWNAHQMPIYVHKSVQHQNR